MTSTTTDHPNFESELVSVIPHLRAFARSLCGDVVQGEDLAQDALSKAWASQHSYQPGTNLKAWIFTIVRNQFYSNKRRDWRSVELDPEVAERTLVSADNPTDTLELDELRRALAMLSADQREALLLIGAAGLAYDDAATILGVAVGTVKSRVSRARDQLALIYARGAITPDGDTPSAAMAAIFLQADAARHRRCA